MERDEEAEQQKISKFNSTLAILYRIDILWKDAHRHSRSGKLIKWNWDLDRVWCELAADAKGDDTTKLKELDTEIAKALKENNRPKLYSELLKKEIYLRKLENKQGKGISYAESMEDYMD